MKQRIITAVVLLCLLVAVVKLSNEPIFILFNGALLGLALYELLGMLRLRSKLSAWLTVLTVCLTLGAIYHFVGLAWLLSLGVVVWLLLFALLAYYACCPFVSSRFNVLACVLGTMVCVVFVMSTYTLWHQAGPDALLAVVVFVSVTDSMAYVLGRRMGRHPLLLKVSPGKTIEGAMGGVGCGLLFAWGMAYLFDVQYPWAHWVPVVALLAVIAVLGDLAESMLKRILQVKDSGAFLPGHGGVLDRIDSLLAVLPFSALAYRYVQEGHTIWLF